MANVESLMILSGITIISGVSLWMLNNKTPKKSPTPKKRSRQRSPTPEWSPTPMKEEEIKTPLPTIRKTPKVMPKIKTPPMSPKVTPKVTPKTKTPKETPRKRTPRRNTLKIIIPKTPRASPIPEPRVKFGRTPKPILKRTRRRLSDESISSTNATINTEATDRNNL
jgi:hypothetical protein